MSERMREQFEEFHRKHLESIGMDPQDIASEFDRKDDGEYVYIMAADGWLYWQASREAVMVELKRYDQSYGCDEWHESADGLMMDSSEVITAIEAQGLKVRQ